MNVYENFGHSTKIKKQSGEIHTGPLVDNTPIKIV